MFGSNHPPVGRIVRVQTNRKILGDCEIMVHTHIPAKKVMSIQSSHIQGFEILITAVEIERRTPPFGKSKRKIKIKPVYIGSSEVFISITDLFGVVVLERFLDNHVISPIV